MVRPKSRVSKVLMVGPLVPFADDLSSTLEASGYTPLTIVNQLRLMAHVSRWMDGRNYSVADLRMRFSRSTWPLRTPRGGCPCAHRAGKSVV